VPYCSPQRFLANDRNAIRQATLVPSSVLPIDDGVLSVATARNGTAQVKLTGSYTGTEAATYDAEIVDDTATVPLISAPILTGEGSGALSAISFTGPAQQITVELAESGLPLLAAGVDLEGVAIKARTAGAVGNGISISIDQSGLTFAPQSFSLLQELAPGQGGQDTPLRGAEYDYDTKIMGANGQIPADAHRIAFGADTSAIYTQYKAYKDGEWLYYLVPALKRGVARGAVISFVTGGRTVTVGTGSPAENTYAGIVTLYDLLNAIKTDLGSPSAPLLDVDGVIANDRAPAGQAAQELQTRTDAHVEPSYGTGSAAAIGFEGTSCSAGAGTQLVIATCRAVTPNDHPLAHVGLTQWELKSSTLGDLGTIIEGVPYSGAEFGVTVPRRLPYGFGGQRGDFTVTNISYAARANSDPDPAPICPGVGERAGLLGPAATDQSLTWVYTKRPTGNCACVSMPMPNLNTACLGNEGLTEGGATMAYQEDTRARIEALRIWFTTTVRGNSAVGAIGVGGAQANEKGFISAPTSTTGLIVSVSAYLSLTAIVDRFESAIALIDPLAAGSPSLRGNGCLAWDDAFDELKADIVTFTAVGYLTDIPSDRYTARLGAVLIAAGISPLGESDATTVSGDGCWRDYGDAYYWVGVGAAGAYAPAFTNHPCYSARRSTSGVYYSTHEFAFQINVKCPDDLREGDTITQAIGNAAWPTIYQVGDELILPIIAASDLYLAGGQDASLVQTWLVNGSIAGPFPSYLYDPDAPIAYSDGSPDVLTFTLTPGGIPFAKGDKFSFSVEGGHYRWRKNAAAWSASIPIPAGTAALDAGLSIEFLTGASPSFVADDMFSFLALQPWAASNIQTPDPDPWKWSGAGGSIVADRGSVVNVDAAAFAYHTLPAGATITIEGGIASGVYTWTETAAWQDGTIAAIFAATQATRYIRLTVANATGGQIGWWWCGEGLGTELSANVTPHRTYSIARAEGGLYQRGVFLGKGKGAEVEWTEGSLTETDASNIASTADWVKTNGDEPLVFVANITRPSEASLVQITDDEIAEHDTSDANRDVAFDRRFDGHLSLGAVLQ
jgi:hypothetical protein